MTEHTKEPWFHDGDAIYNNADCVGDPIVHVMSCAYDNDLNNMDARRIVACVNYCAGYDTVGMETAASAGRTAKVSNDYVYAELTKLSGEVDKLQSQRDQLLAALEAVRNAGEWYTSAIELNMNIDGNELLAVVDKAIAAVKGD